MDYFKLNMISLSTDVFYTCCLDMRHPNARMMSITRVIHHRPKECLKK